MEFTEFLGNAGIRERFQRYAESRSIPHAIIIEGPDGSGKSTLARYIALLLNCPDSPDVCLKCTQCKKITSLNHPDVIYSSLLPGRTQIGIDTVRFIRSDVYIMPNESESKVYIIGDSDKMTAEAQNAFLKVLEEPPAYAVFILLCENADSLLATVRSRAVTVHTERFSCSDIENYLIQTNAEARLMHDASPDSLKLAILLSEGCVGKAIENIVPETAEKNISLYDRCRGFLKLLRRRASAYEIMSFLLDRIPERQYITSFLQMFENAVSDIIRFKLSDSSHPSFFIDDKEMCLAASSLTCTFLLESAELTEKCISALSYNANIQAAVTAYAHGICSLREKY